MPKSLNDRVASVERKLQYASGAVTVLVLAGIIGGVAMKRLDSQIADAKESLAALKRQISAVKEDFERRTTEMMRRVDEYAHTKVQQEAEAAMAERDKRLDAATSQIAVIRQVLSNPITRELGDCTSKGSDRELCVATCKAGVAVGGWCWGEGVLYGSGTTLNKPKSFQCDYLGGQTHHVEAVCITPLH